MYKDLYRPREFANKTGVTVRTLHHYDRIGLLRPATVSESGHRLYGMHELARLERIVALKFIGFPLRSIRQLLDERQTDLPATLGEQRRTVQKMRDHLDEVLRAIERAEAVVGAPGETEWDALKAIIELMEAHANMDWAKKYYTEAQLADLASRATPETLAQGEQDWKALLADVGAALNEDPAGARAQALAARWSELIERFTGGDAGIAHNLRRLYADRAKWPADFQQPFSDEAANFIARAVAARKK